MSENKTPDKQETPRSNEAKGLVTLEHGNRVWAVPLELSQDLERELAALSKDYGNLVSEHHREVLALSARGVTAEIAAERERQIQEEGWDAEHDDEHPEGNLSAAAACYAAGVQLYDEQERNIWPWEERWWKPKNRRRDLIRAAALIIAEIEKMDRKTQYVGEKK